MMYLMNKIKAYVKARDEMLRKRSVAELERFVEAHKEDLAEGFAKRFKSAPQKVKEATLHKMIVNATSLPDTMRDESAAWLIEHGFGVGIGG